MDTLTTIATRRSIRTYTNEPLEQSLVEDIVHYGLYAPSAHNQQAWKFFLISKPKDREFLWDLMEFGKMLPQASWVVLVSFDKEKLKSPEFIQQDMGASIQNILLAAHEKKVWAVWIGTYPHEVEMQAIHQYFWLQDQIVPFALIALGIPSWEIREKFIKAEGKIIAL